ncbi:ATPase H(+)-transporting accessory protein 2-like [Rhagoletis pomonella]|uniref:ATPase H(+)-transporting accessory protein 2-like n=1 Tax=Rhagoletis pomonella TaxID=28610 RepID=UPI0017839830|nr:ATPase H(+)-transporting accessory protein 2-like [Rhagoletis pomonella]
MLRIFAIFMFCFLAVQGDGRFYVLNAPESLSFQAVSTALPSEQVDDVIKAARGLDVSDSANFPGLVITDPFALPQKVVVVDVIGLNEVPLSDVVVSYKLKGKSVSSYLDDLNVGLTQDPSDCNIKLSSNQKSELVNCVETQVKSNNEFILAKINVSKLVKSGVDKALVSELKTLQAKIEGESPNLLFVVLTHKDDGSNSRRRRDTLAGSKTNSYNLAAYYDENYPVIFNIILWFMVALGLSLLAVCYAIADMDPGRDSIIYRMTSTRMKKDN